MKQTIDRYLDSIKSRGLYRSRILAERKGFCNFSSNDYLCLADDKQVQQAFQKAFEKYPVGSGASQAVCGYHTAHKMLEDAFSQFMDVDGALLFSSGYAANLAIVSMLAKLDTHVIIDKCVHASFYDGISLAAARYTRFLHNDRNDLLKKLAQQDNGGVVLSEGIFSMSGQQPDLRQMAKDTHPHNYVCIIDEAHSFGVLGERGRGATTFYGLSQKEIPLRIIPFGKAMGAQGAIVIGQGEWIEALFQSGRSTIYSTAISPALAYGLLYSLEALERADEKRTHIKQLITYFKGKIQKSPLRWRDSSTAIQQLQLGCPEQAANYTTQLLERKIICLCMREPTVSRRETGLRVVLNANHCQKDIDYLFASLHEIYEN
ncbi:8-amino-7-oxononanoate synthase [Legionella birminghamensis]|uniref:8-amino-7-oxononanoate synthase n=1 Tax=Legionella birminghamensis TaxID=28083 RepID=A0A378IHA7_9GAMM|nr:aminotransferase class I/II-fold pyridoxal phosphate-dependent enzyme [Legionella birminghamensis]KTC69302.1 8-amino-7-oxononanoate synthase [Legionella birminghamensis]STX31564.1 8-amino-7-oxononanoate synthase [Legionella birminghamensis]